MFAPMILGLPQGSEIVILIILALLIFGGSRLAGVGKGAGKAIREFKEETEGLMSSGKQKPAATAPKEPGQADEAIAEAEIVDPEAEETK